MKALCTTFVLVAFIQCSYANRQKGVLEIKNVVVSFLCQERDPQISLYAYKDQSDTALCNVYKKTTNVECLKLEELWNRAESKCNESETDSVFLKCYSDDILAHLILNKDDREGKEDFQKLKHEIQGIIARNAPPRPRSSEPVSKPEPNVEPSGGSVDKAAFNWLGLAGVILSFISIGALIFLWIQFNRLKEETERRLSARLKKEDAQKLSNDISWLLQDLKSKISLSDFSEFRTEIERKVSKIEKQTERSSTSPLGAETTKLESAKTSPTAQKRYLDKYAFFPESNLFEDKTLQDDKDHNEAIYHLSFREDSNHGEYKINQSAKAIQMALSDVSAFLSPGTDSENLPSGSTAIVNLSPGELKKTSDGWQIVKKAKIKFE